jgi:endoglucanase
VNLRNLAGSAVRGWTLGWRFGGDQRIRNLWNGRLSQHGRQVEVRDDGWNAAVPAGESVQFGFEVSAAPPSTDPTRFTLNGAPCG